MKRLLFALIISVVVLSQLVSGASINFQDPSAFSAQVVCSGTCTYSQNASGGNDAVIVTTNTGPRLSYASPTTYAAMSIPSNNQGSITLYDAALNILWQSSVDSSPYADNGWNRVELKMIGSEAYWYVSGVQIEKSGVLAQNPSYVAFNTRVMGGTYDDLVYGSTESKYVFGAPRSGFFLMKDTLNPAASGFYKANTTDPNGAPTLIYSTKLPVSYSKASGDPETLVLNEYGGGNYASLTTTRWADNVNFNLTEFFADSNAAPYGLYVVTIPGTVEYSNTIPYIGSGATITLDKDTYGVGETAVADVIITDGYFDTDTYSYQVKIQDIFGTVVSDQPITISTGASHTGTVSYTWAEDDDTGVYYAAIVATRLSDSEEIMMNYDICELTSSVILSGYVKDAETTLALSNATVTVSQGTVTDTLTSGTDGNYTSTSDFAINAPLTITSTITGYQNYTHTFTPLVAGTQTNVNISMVPTIPTHAGILLYGLVMTPPYNRTVDNANIYVSNGSILYSTTTNGAGYYEVDEMYNNFVWDVVAAKSGYSNSTTYRVLVTGS